MINGWMSCHGPSRDFAVAVARPQPVFSMGRVTTGDPGEMAFGPQRSLLGPGISAGQSAFDQLKGEHGRLVMFGALLFWAGHFVPSSG
jgi:hypothetical protein